VFVFNVGSFTEFALLNMPRSTKMLGKSTVM